MFWQRLGNLQKETTPQIIVRIQGKARKGIACKDLVKPALYKDHKDYLDFYTVPELCVS